MADSLTTSKGDDLTAKGPDGSIVENLYVRRQVTVLAVHDHEVETLSIMNGLSNLFLSLASACLFFAIGIWVTAAFQETVSPAGQVMVRVIGPAFSVLAIIFAVAGGIFLRRRGTTISKIRDQSESSE